MKSCPRLFRAIAMASALALSAPAFAEEAISLNFINADIGAVVKAVSHATGKSFLLDPRVKGTVNLVSGNPVQPALALDILGAALRLQGFAIVESNGVLKVLPEADAKTQAGVSRPGRSQPGMALTTRVFQVRNESAVQLVPVLRPLITANNTIAAYAGNNTLVITDYADNLARIEQIIAAIDFAPEGELDVIPVAHASAVDIAATLNRLYADGATGAAQGAQPDGSQRAVILADVRSNSVLVRAENAGKRTRIRQLVASLDRQTSASGNIHVVRLKHASATDLAQVLRATLGSGEAAGSATSATATQAVGNLATQTRPAGGATANTGLAAGSMVQADIATNSLIITAPDAVYNNLRAVIDQLDRRRAQVHIEAVIVELTADKASEFGIQWQSLTSGNSARLVGGTNFGTGGTNIVGLMENIAKVETSGTLGLSPGLNVGVLTGNNTLGALLRALEADTQANILSTPSITTLDNEKAEIVIGQNVPFVTGSFTQTGNAVTNPFQTFERRDVGLSLKVKPMITDGGVVRVEIFQEASSLQETSLSNSAGPITNKRSMSSTVLVDDGAIVVLGGLMDDRYDSGEDRVPLLGDAPIIGGLFRYENRKRAKTNLMVFLRPQIIRDAADARGTTDRLYEDMLRRQSSFAAGQRDGRGADAPQLPPRSAAVPTAATPPSPQ